MEISKVTRIEHATLGKRFLAFFFDVVLMLFIGLGVYIGVSQIFSQVDSIDEMKVKYNDIITESGIMNVENDNIVYKSYTSYEEATESIFNFYNVYVPKYSDANSISKEWFNVFVLGLDDINSTYTNEDLGKRSSAVKLGKELFEYQQVDGAIKSDELGIPKAYNQGEKTFNDIADDDQKKILNYFNSQDNEAESVMYSCIKTVSYFKELNDLYNSYILYNTTIPLIMGVAIGYIIFFIIMPLCLKDGKTLGKLFMKISVVSITYYSVKKTQIVLRYVPQICLFIIAVLFTGLNIFTISVGTMIIIASYLMAIFRENHQSVHDMVAGTFVVSDVDSIWFKNAQFEAAAIKEKESIVG